MRYCARSHRSYLGFGLVFLAASQLLPGKDKEKQKPAEPYALLYGTCFDGRGFSLPGASVVVELASEPAGKVKKKKWELVSSPRGSLRFVFQPGAKHFESPPPKTASSPPKKQFRLKQMSGRIWSCTWKLTRAGSSSAVWRPSGDSESRPEK